MGSLHCILHHTRVLKQVNYAYAAILFIGFWTSTEHVAWRTLSGYGDLESQWKSLHRQEAFCYQLVSGTQLLMNDNYLLTLRLMSVMEIQNRLTYWQDWRPRQVSSVWGSGASQCGHVAAEDVSQCSRWPQSAEESHGLSHGWQYWWLQCSCCQHCHCHLHSHWTGMHNQFRLSISFSTCIRQVCECRLFMIGNVCDRIQLRMCARLTVWLSWRRQVTMVKISTSAAPCRPLNWAL